MIVVRKIKKAVCRLNEHLLTVGRTLLSKSINVQPFSLKVYEEKNAAPCDCLTPLREGVFRRKTTYLKKSGSMQGVVGGWENEGEPSTSKVINIKGILALQRKVEGRLDGSDWLKFWEQMSPERVDNRILSNSENPTPIIYDFGGVGDCLYRCLAAAVYGDSKMSGSMYESLKDYAEDKELARLNAYTTPAGQEAVDAFCARYMCNVAVYVDGQLAYLCGPSEYRENWTISLSNYKEHWTLIGHEKASSCENMDIRGYAKGFSVLLDERQGLEVCHFGGAYQGTQMVAAMELATRKSWLARWVEHESKHPSLDSCSFITYRGRKSLMRALSASETEDGKEPCRNPEILSYHEPSRFAMHHNCLVHLKYKEEWQTFRPVDCTNSWSVTVEIVDAREARLYLFPGYEKEVYDWSTQVTYSKFRDGVYIYKSGGFSDRKRRLLTWLEERLYSLNGRIGSSADFLILGSRNRSFFRDYSWATLRLIITVSSMTNPIETFLWIFPVIFLSTDYTRASFLTVWDSLFMSLAIMYGLYFSVLGKLLSRRKRAFAVNWIGMEIYRRTGLKPRSRIFPLAVHTLKTVVSYAEKNSAFSNVYGEASSQVSLQGLGFLKGALWNVLTRVFRNLPLESSELDILGRDWSKERTDEVEIENPISSMMKIGLGFPAELKSQVVPNLKIKLPKKSSLRDMQPEEKAEGFIFAVYGTHGDHQPTKYIMQSFKDAGADVEFFAPLSAGIGSADLKDLEEGGGLASAESSMNVSIQLNAIRGKRWPVATASFFEWPSQHTTLILEPPLGASEKFCMPNKLIDIGSEIIYGPILEGLRINNSATSIGFPTNDMKPLRRYTRFFKREAKGYNYGSSGDEYTPPQNAVEIGRGNHAVMFREYGQVYCHGGSGTMKTAIASGAEAVSQSDVLDRRWKENAHEKVYFTNSRFWNVYSTYYQETELRHVKNPITIKTLLALDVIKMAAVCASLPRNALQCFIGLLRCSRCLILLIVSLKSLPVRTSVGNKEANGLLWSILKLASSYIGVEGLRSLGKVSPASYRRNPLLFLRLFKAIAVKGSGSTAVVEVSTGFAGLWPDTERAAIVLEQLKDYKLWAHVSVNWKEEIVEAGYNRGNTQMKLSKRNPDGLRIGLPFRGPLNPPCGKSNKYGSMHNCVTNTISYVMENSPGYSWVAPVSILSVLFLHTAPPLFILDTIRSLSEILGFEKVDRLIAGVIEEETEEPASRTLSRADKRKKKKEKNVAFSDTTELTQRELSKLKVGWWRTWSVAPELSTGNFEILPNLEMDIRHIRYGLCVALDEYHKGNLNARMIRPLNSWMSTRACVCGELWSNRDPTALCPLCFHANYDRSKWDPRNVLKGLMCTTSVLCESENLEDLVDAFSLFLQDPVTCSYLDEKLEERRYTSVSNFQGKTTEVNAECTFGTFSSVSFSFDEKHTSISRNVPKPGEFRHSTKELPIDEAPDTQIIEWAAAMTRRAIISGAELLTVLQDPIVQYALSKEDPSPGRQKAAWLTEFRRRFGPLTRKDFQRRPEVRAFITEKASSADMEYARTVAWMNEKVPENQEKLSPKFKPRRFRTLKEHPEFLQRLNRLEQIMTVKEGANCLEYLNPDTVRLSAARYEPEPTKGTATAEDAHVVARAILAEYPELFFPADVADPALVARKMVKKFSCGIPFEGQKAMKRNGEELLMRRRSDLMKTGWMNSLIDSTREVLVKGGAVPGMLHHVFVKDYITERAKLEENPAKARTVIAQSMPWYMITKSLNYYFDKRNPQHWPTIPPKAGMPLTGAGYNYVLKRYDDCSQVFVMDMTAADANENTEAIEIIKEIRKSMYQHLDDSEAISEIIDRSFDALESGHMISLLDGENLPKNRGLSTGQASVTTDGSWIIVGIKIDVLSKYWNVSAREAFQRCVISNMHDDALVGVKRGYEVDTEKIVAIIKERWGMPCRLEWEGKSVVGSPWLRKTVHSSDDFAQDFEEAGIEKPTYAIVHDIESIKTRQAATLRATGLKYAYERTLGHLLLCVHDKVMYDFLHSEAELLRRKLAANRSNKNWLRSRKIPNRMEAIRRFYKPFNLPYRYTRKMTIYDATKIANNLFSASYFGIMSTLRTVSSFSWKGETLVTGSMDAWPSKTEKLSRGIDCIAHYPATRESYRGVVARSPFAYVVDVDRYWRKRKIKEVPDEIARAPLEWYYFTTILVSDLYKRAKKSIFSSVALAYHSYTNDGSVLYAIFSFPYWLDDGKTSQFLVGLMPKDPAYMLKRVCGFVIDYPEFEYPPLLRPEGWRAIAKTIDDIGKFVKPQIIDDPISWSTGISATPKWDTYFLTRVAPALDAGAKTLLVVSPTGTGKTREFIPLLRRRYKSIIVGSPRKVTASEVFGAKRLMRGTKYEPGNLYSCTYGHLAARLTGSSVRDADNVLFIFDEVHDSNPDTLLALSSLPQNSVVIYVTATPEACASFMYRPPEYNLDTGFPSKHSVMTHVVPHMTALDVLALPEVRNKPGRKLIITPLLTKARELSNRLSAAGYDSDVFSRYDPLPSSSIIVATQIVEAGVNIKGLTVVIDEGLRLVSHKGCLCMIPVDEATSTQRNGRTGRFGDGVAYTLREPRPFTVMTYPNIWVLRYRKELMSDVYDFTAVPHGVKDKSALFDVAINTTPCLTNAEWELCIQYYLSHPSREDALRGWRMGAHDTPLFDERFQESGGLKTVLDNKDWLETVTNRNDLFTFQYRMGYPTTCNWVTLRNNRVISDSSRAQMLFDLRGTSLLFTELTDLKIPGFPGRVTPVGPPIRIGNHAVRRFPRMLLSACLIDVTVSHYEEYAGRIPQYKEGTEASEWVCEVIRWFAESLGTSFAVIGDFGSRIINAGCAIEPTVAGVLCGKSMAQLFTVYSSERVKMSNLSRRLLLVHQSRMNLGVCLGYLPLVASQENFMKKYMPINFDFEKSFRKWYSVLETPLLQGTNSCVTRLLNYYEQEGSVNHVRTMELFSTKVVELATGFAELHQCCVCLVTFTDCGNFCKRQRYWPRMSSAHSEVAWLCRNGHVQPLQYRRNTQPTDYTPKNSFDAPNTNETWQGKLNEPGFFRLIKLEINEEVMSRRTEYYPTVLGSYFADEMKFKKTPEDIKTYIHHCSERFLSHFPKNLMKRAGDYASDGYKVVINHGARSVVLSFKFDDEIEIKPFICLASRNGKVARRTLAGDVSDQSHQTMTECMITAQNMSYTVFEPKTVEKGRRIANIPSRAAGLFLLYEDPHYFAYLPNHTSIGKSHKENMCGLTPEGIQIYCRSILAPRLEKSQHNRLRQAARAFRKQYRLSRPNHVVVDGAYLSVRAPSTLGNSEHEA